MEGRKKQLEEITARGSFLSPPVRKLLQKATAPSSSSSSSSWVSPDGHINWEKIEEALAGVPGEEWGEAWYEGAVEALAPFLPQCYAVVVEGPDGIPSPAPFMPYLAWMGQDEGMRQCMELLVRGTGACDHLAALLCLTALAERALGELVLMHGGQVPFLLRDLLDTPLLQQVMGTSWVTVAKVLVGSVLGLNLRNLAWHGFLSPEETQPSPVCALLLMLAECGQVLERGEGRKAILRRPAVLLSLKEGVGMEVEGQVWPSCEVVEEIVDSCCLAPVVMKQVWRMALEHLYDGRPWVGLALLLPQLECSLRCLFAWANAVPSRVLTAQHTVLYTTLDHALAAQVDSGGEGGGEGGGTSESAVASGGGERNRKGTVTLRGVKGVGAEGREGGGGGGVKGGDCGVYCGERERGGGDKEYISANFLEEGIDKSNVKEEEEEEGEPDSTTKQITDRCQNTPPQSTTPQGNMDNKVLSLLGTQLTEALFDLLSFSQGPRVRDRVSHGEAGAGDVSQSTVLHVLHLCLLVLVCGEEEREREVVVEGCHSSSISSSSSSLNMSNPANDTRIHHHHHCHSQQASIFTNLSPDAQDAIHSLKRWVSGYRSHFHPTSLLHGSLHSSTSFLSEWREWKRAERSEMDYVEWEEQEVEEMMEGIRDTPVTDEMEDGERKRIRCDVEVKMTSEKLEKEEEDERTEQSKLKENKDMEKDEKARNESIKAERMNRMSKIPARISYHPLPSSHVIFTLAETPQFLTQIHLLQYRVLHRPRAELEVVSALRRITSNTQVALHNTRQSLHLKHTQFEEKKMRSRRRETYKRQLNAVPAVVWNCSLVLQTVYMLFLSLHSIPDLSKDSFSRLLRLLKGVLKAMENLVSQTDPQTNRWEEAACGSRENVAFILRNLWRP